jgi:hypothetical protein
VAISGNTVVFGSSNSTIGTNAAQGAAYVFQAPAGPSPTLNQVAKLTASAGAANDRFGFSVAIDGNTVVVGGPNAKIGTDANQGAVYVFLEPTGQRQPGRVARAQSPICQAVATMGQDQPDAPRINLPGQGARRTQGERQPGSRIPTGRSAKVKPCSNPAGPLRYHSVIDPRR